ncbi:MAG: LysR family transcriptional regulator [Lachnospiraceae bacterium]
MYHISFHQIYYFLTLAQTLSFTETSHMLYISQPTLSKQITALETELGFTLFNRTKRSVELVWKADFASAELELFKNLMLCRNTPESISQDGLPGI